MILFFFSSIFKFSCFNQHPGAFVAWWVELVEDDVFSTRDREALNRRAQRASSISPA